MRVVLVINHHRQISKNNDENHEDASNVSVITCCVHLVYGKKNNNYCITGAYLDNLSTV